MVTLTKTQRKEIIKALRTMGDKVSTLIETLNTKDDKGTLCAGEEWLLSNLGQVEFYEGSPSRPNLEKRSDEDLYEMVTDFGMTAESLWSDLDGDGEWPNGSRAKGILDNFIKVARKYSRPRVWG